LNGISEKEQLKRTTSTLEAEKTTPKRNGYGFWMPRFWHGMVLSAWLKLLKRNRYAVHPLRIPMAGMITLIATANSALGAMQQAKIGHRLDNLRLRRPPVFIIGHWRSGTTFLHELLVRDPQHTYPTTYECFCPAHFLLTGRIASKYLGFLLPSQRPMDNVRTGWNRPQEDEFALCGLGSPSPYLTMAFPNHSPIDQDYLDFDGVSREDIEEWKSTLMWFLRRITVRTSKRIILKSPPHTSRVDVLRQMFPDAKFIHIVRDPYTLFPSTVKLWKSLYTIQGLQIPRFIGLNEHVLETLPRMYKSFNKQVGQLRPNQFCQLKYEDLVADPINQVRRIYETLELESFESMLPQLVEFVQEESGYQPNRHRLAPELCEAISQRWEFYFNDYGYAKEQHF